MSIVKNLKALNTKIDSKVKIVVVVNNCSIRTINQVLFLELKDVAESNVFNAKKKKRLVKYSSSWHFIGSLNKKNLKEVVDTFDVIQTLDSYKIAKKLNSICIKNNKKMAVLIQVNISNKPNVAGVKKEELQSFLENISLLKNISVLGLRYNDFNSEIVSEEYFKEMNELFKTIKRKKLQNIKMKYLSMGTTQNYEEAIKHNSNMLLLQKAIFDVKK